MAQTREVRGPTPAGGVRSEARFLRLVGGQWTRVDESEATRVEIVEYGSSGDEIARTYGTIPRGRKKN